MLSQSHGTNVDAPPNFLGDLHVGPKMKQRKNKYRTCFTIHNILGIRKHVGALKWDYTNS
jgi:hypothetical protein